MTCIVAIIDGKCVVMGSDSGSSLEGDDLIRKRAGVSKVWKVHIPVILKKQNYFKNKKNNKSRFRKQDKKVVGGENLIVGFCGTFGEGLFIRHGFQWPLIEQGQTVENWLVKNVQPSLNKSLKQRFGEHEEFDWSLLIGVKPGRVFALLPCGDVEESVENYSSIGSGSVAALSTLKTMDYMQENNKWNTSNMYSWEKADAALRVAACLHTSVQSPFHCDVLI